MLNFIQMERGYKLIPMPQQGLDDFTTWINLSKAGVSDTSVHCVEYLGVTIKPVTKLSDTLNEDTDDTESESELSTTVIHCADSKHSDEQKTMAELNIDSESIGRSHNENNDEIFDSESNGCSQNKNKDEIFDSESIGCLQNENSAKIFDSDSNGCLQNKNNDEIFDSQSNGCLQNEISDEICSSAEKESINVENDKTHFNKNNRKHFLAKTKHNVFSKSSFNLHRNYECGEIPSDISIDKSKFRRRWISRSAGALLTSFKRKEFDNSNKTDEAIAKKDEEFTRDCSELKSDVDYSECRHASESVTHSENLNKLDCKRVENLDEPAIMCINCNQGKSKCKDCSTDTKSETVENLESSSSLQDAGLNEDKAKTLIFHPLEKLISHRSNIKHKKKCAFSFTLFLCGCSRRRSFQ